MNYSTILQKIKQIISLVVVFAVLLSLQLLPGFAEENESDLQPVIAEEALSSGISPESSVEQEDFGEVTMLSEEGETDDASAESDIGEESMATEVEITGETPEGNQADLQPEDQIESTGESGQEVQTEEPLAQEVLAETETIEEESSEAEQENAENEKNEEESAEEPEEGTNSGEKEPEEELPVPDPEVEEFFSLAEYNRAIAQLSEEFGIGNDCLPMEQYGGSTDNPYLTKRIILVTNAALPEHTGAIRILRYGTEYVLQFETEEKTEQAYQVLIDSGVHEAVLPDLVVEEEPGMDSGFLFSAKRPGESREHYSWGVAATGLDTMLNRIRDNGIIPAGVTVAVLDSGVTIENPYLAGRLLAGYNALDASDDITDEMGHGTHVAGIIVDGTDTCVSILPIKVFNADGRGPILAVKNAILYALENGASVINLSMSGLDRKRTVTYLENTFQQAIDAGTVICVSAGNQASDVMDYYPSRSDKVLTVAALEQSGDKMRRAGYSNYGDAIDFALPGSQIYSTLGTGLGYKSGTSMASPHVVAAIAMIKSVSGGMGFWDIKNTLIQFCDNDLIEGREGLEPGAWDTQCGYGCFNLTDYIPPFRFDDVTDSETYYYDPVYWAWENGLTVGTSPATFSPNAACTRGQFVTFLWHMKGDPEPTGINPFSDVQETDYFYKAALWAKEQGITAGTSASTFSPTRVCTRGQIMAFLWKAMGSAEPTIQNPFIDINETDYFFKAVLWAKEQGITSGTSANSFSPEKTCTRAQAMTFLYKANN